MKALLKSNKIINVTFGVGLLLLIIKIAALGYEFGQWLKSN